MRLIDSEPLVEYFEGLARSLANARYFSAADAIQGAAEKLRNAPAVDVEPVRHGRWILKAHDKKVNCLWTVTAYCSECCDEEKEIWSGYFPGVPDCIAKDVALDSARTVKSSNYCPNCGAKMDEEVQHAEKRSDP